MYYKTIPRYVNVRPRGPNTFSISRSSLSGRNGFSKNALTGSQVSSGMKS